MGGDIVSKERDRVPLAKALIPRDGTEPPLHLGGAGPALPAHVSRRHLSSEAPITYSRQNARPVARTFEAPR